MEDALEYIQVTTLFAVIALLQVAACSSSFILGIKALKIYRKIQLLQKDCFVEGRDHCPGSLLEIYSELELWLSHSLLSLGTLVLEAGCLKNKKCFFSLISVALAVPFCYKFLLPATCSFLPVLNSALSHSASLMPKPLTVAGI